MQPLGRSAPLGASIDDGGVNFSLFSKNSTRVELLLFDHVGDTKPSRVITLDSRRNRPHGLRRFQSCYHGGRRGLVLGDTKRGRVHPFGEIIARWLRETCR